jgi:hypothetical protein
MTTNYGAPHSCKGDAINPESHDCTCVIGRNHTAAQHRRAIRA